MTAKYKLNYLKAHNLTIADFIPCDECGAEAVDIHHKKKRSQLGGDEAENLIALCRRHHEQYHR